jgi:hypothetical protein
MWPPAVIMLGPLTNNPLGMMFVEGNQEIETFATKAPAHSLAHRVGLRGSHGRPQTSDPHVRETLVDVLRSVRWQCAPLPRSDSAAISRMSRRKSLGICGLPTGRDFQRQKRRNPLRCQRRNVSGLTFTRASRHENMRPSIRIISRVESCARRGFTFRS